jgi:hypothetical protein
MIPSSAPHGGCEEEHIIICPKLGQTIIQKSGPRFHHIITEDLFMMLAITEET